MARERNEADYYGYEQDKARRNTIAAWISHRAIDVMTGGAKFRRDATLRQIEQNLVWAEHDATARVVNGIQYDTHENLDGSVTGSATDANGKIEVTQTHTADAIGMSSTPRVELSNLNELTTAQLNTLNGNLIRARYDDPKDHYDLAA